MMTSLSFTGATGYVKYFMIEVRVRVKLRS
jgi:hypothetical protein